MDEAPHKTAAVQPLISHLSIHPSKCGKYLGTAGEVRMNSEATLSYGLLPTNNYLHKLCVDSVCNLKDLLGVMDDQDGWQESS